MTLGQAKQIVRFLLDSELFDQYEEKRNAYFNMGQKRVAATTDFIEKTKTLTLSQPTEIDMEQLDASFYKLRRVTGGEWERLSPTSVRLEKGTYVLHYCVFPSTITAHTSDAYAFEISEAAQSALPYYVASQVTIAEHDLRYHQVYYDEFAGILENVDAMNKQANMHITQMER